jgi:ABC-type uncharacterized transport system substrate-binding protein
MGAFAIGVVDHLNRPGGNVTGIAFMGSELAAKRLNLLHALVPSAARAALLINPVKSTDLMVREFKAAAASISVQTAVLSATTSDEIDTAFATLRQRQVDTLTVSPDVLFVDHRDQIIALAAHQSVPANLRCAGLCRSWRADELRRKPFGVLFANMESLSAASSRVRARPTCRLSDRPSSST